jgi:gamma-glutamylcyclotransferase (GGCT)/AIG2-like uncharacterized protein YtfP
VPKRWFGADVTPPHPPLFAYGTLRDPEYQRELFGAEFALEPARVCGFSVRGSAGGYLAAAADPGGVIEGALVHLDAAALTIADAWEDLSVYARAAAEAQLADGRRVPCFLYVRPGWTGAPVTDGRLADRPRADVIADIRRFRAELDADAK